MRSTSDVLRWIRFLRVRDWFYLLGIAALVLVRNFAAVDVGVALRVFAFSACYLCWGYVFNNSFDQHEDSVEKNAFKTEGRSIVAGVTLALSGLLIVAAAAWNVLVPTLAVMVLNVAYSAPPIRLKRFLVGALAANAVFFGFIAYCASKMTAGEVAGPELAFAGFVSAMFIPLQYVHHLEHQEEAGTPVSRATRIIAASLFALLAGLAVGLAIEPSLPFDVVSVVYCAVGAALSSTMKTAGRARCHLRWLSAAFGVALLVVMWVAR